MQLIIPTLLAVLSAGSTVVATPTYGHKSEHDKSKVNKPIFDFAKTFFVTATPDQVVNNVSVSAPGEPGAIGYYRFGLQPETNTICYNITFLGVTGNYSSPALTATHIHESARGRSGPPRIAFPNPVGDDTRRISLGCITGPFKTGILVNGTDTGDGFEIQEILDNPTGFNADAHTTKYLPGVIRGQFPDC
ncbi:MAG: hypothetical protein M1833_003521 [Piccolia ochrophora]|nr:MAG: hypothetical protein M1833_003521 [Piccolia ochrophora]